MKKNKYIIEQIPAIVWGEPSDAVYLFVHGKMSKKEEAEGFAEIATTHGFQVVSFDLPEHGERLETPYPCTVQNAINDLGHILKYTEKHWQKVNLFACSLGAYFSLIAYKDVKFNKCLFLSPILDMERLIQNMMGWFGVNADQLQEKKEIPTPIGETLSWEYYEYVRNHPIQTWNVPTNILYGDRDNLTEKRVLDDFVNKFHASVQTVQGGEHYFQTEEHVCILNEWINSSIQVK